MVSVEKPSVVLVHTTPPQAVFELFVLSPTDAVMEQGPAYFSNLIFNEDELAGTYAYGPSHFRRYYDRLSPLNLDL